MTTDVSPAHNPYLDPGAFPAAHQGAPGVTLWGEAGLSEHLHTGFFMELLSPDSNGPGGDRRQRTEDRGRGQVGSHLAGVLALTPSTQHVLLDDLDSVVGRVLVALVTDPVSHNGNHHFLELVGPGWRSCGEGLAENQG